MEWKTTMFTCVVKRCFLSKTYIPAGESHIPRSSSILFLEYVNLEKLNLTYFSAVVAKKKGGGVGAEINSIKLLERKKAPTLSKANQDIIH